MHNIEIFNRLNLDEQNHEPLYNDIKKYMNTVNLEQNYTFNIKSYGLKITVKRPNMLHAAQDSQLHRIRDNPQNFKWEFTKNTQTENTHTENTHTEKSKFFESKTIDDSKDKFMELLKDYIIIKKR